MNQTSSCQVYLHGTKSFRILVEFHIQITKNNHIKQGEPLPIFNLHLGYSSICMKLGLNYKIVTQTASNMLCLNYTYKHHKQLNFTCSYISRVVLGDLIMKQAFCVTAK